MRINTLRVVTITVFAVLATGGSRLAAQQEQPKPSGTPSYGIELGQRGYVSQLDRLSIGKFEEYRDLRARNNTSPVYEQFSLRFVPNDSFGIYTATARKIGDRDQSMFVRLARPGEFDLQLRFDRIPHTYSTTARSPGSEVIVQGVNTLPVPRPDSLAWRNGSYIGAIRSQWDPFKASLTASPNDHNDIKAEFTRISKTGGVPRSISFSGSSGPQREFVSPINQTVSDFRLGHDFTSGDRSGSSTLPFVKSFQFNVGYAWSRFQNSIKSTFVDNPQLSVSSPTSGVASARVSLEPSNAAQTATATGAVLFPMRTRVTGSFTTSWARQNDAFMPQTSNDSLKSNPNYGLVATLQRASLEGLTRRSTYQYAITTQPLSNLTVSAKHRSFDLDMRTAAFKIKAMVVSDRSIALADSERFEPFPYTKTNSHLSASYLFSRGLALTAGYAWEDWTRDPEVRNLEGTSEKGPVASLDYTTLDWIAFRASYSAGSRRGGKYTEAATEILNFRRFDEADRDRTRASLMASITPIDPVTVALTYQGGGDKFPNSQYGIVQDKSVMTGVDIDWSPSDRYSASVGWSQEDIKDSAHYRYRTGAAGSATYDNATFRWMNTNKDKNTNLYFAFNAKVMPGKLDAEVSWAISDSHWWMYNVNPTTPTGGTATQNLSATAQNWPEVKQRLEPLSLAFHYRYSPSWMFNLRYQYERYSQTDFRTTAPTFTSTGLNDGPVSSNYPPGELPGTIGQVSGSSNGQYHFLGINYRPYTVDWISFSISYNPSLLEWAKGRAVF